MSAGDCLAMARELRRELPPPRPSRLAADLASWRARRAGGEHYLDESCALILFGVGLDTIERIERGEVAPEPDLAERIGRFIYSDASRPRGASVSPAGVMAGSEGGAAVPPPLEAAAPLAIPPPAPALAKGDGSAFHVEIFFGDTIVEMPIAAAASFGAELLALVAIARDPLLYDRQPFDRAQDRPGLASVSREPGEN